jgi:PhzF family phenazine biosynthesis protein
MKTLQIFQIDAFTKELFGGNPAAVCPLDNWLDDDILIAIAAENNLPETAFFVPQGDDFHIRWFTPTQEVVLCGHATLASAFVILNELDPSRDAVRFSSKSGPLSVSSDGDMLTMNFPAWRLKACEKVPDALVRGLGKTPVETWAVETDDNYYAVYETEDDVRAITPDFELLKQLHPAGVVVTAPGDRSDCASRYFAPSYGIPEDPATGSIHCGLTPYWARRLGKERIHARQVSKRGAHLWCHDLGDRVSISGHAIKYLEGTVSV